MNYESMGDFEINKAVAVSLGFEVSQFSNINVGRQWCIKDFVGEDWVLKRIPDYCNSPSDAWPVIADNKISIEYRDHKSLAPVAKRFGSNGHNIADESPLRAAMIVFLMMNDK